MRNYGLLVLFVVVALFGKAQNTKESFTPSGDLLVEGLTLHDEGKYREAINTYRKVSLSDTNGLLVAYELALSYVALEKPDSAIYFANYILGFKTQYRRNAFDILGSAYDLAKQSQKALETYDLGLKEFPTYHKFYYEKGITYQNLKKYPEAVANFQKAIELNPYHASSHMRLGYLALNNDMLVPGVLSMLQFLAIEPATNRSLQVLMTLEKHLKRDTVIDKDSVKYSTPGENTFADLDEMLRSKIALNESYKTKIKLTYYGIIKQLQLMFEKMELNPADKGYWNTYYTPIFKGMADRQLFEPFIYYMFQSINDKVETKMMKKKKKDIVILTDYIINLLGEKRKIREVTMNGAKVKKRHWYYDGGTLSAVGDADDVKQIRIGDWITYSEYGLISSEGKYSKEGKREGVWKYYHDNGNLSSEASYKNDELDGKYTTYVLNGAVNETGTYKKGKVEGPVSSFNAANAPISTLNYKNGLAEGEYLDYDNNGNLEGKYISKADKLNGKFTVFYEDGVKKIEGVYVDNEIDGKYTEYYHNGVLAEEGTFAKGKRINEWKYYFEDKKIKEVGSYLNGVKNGVWKEYHDNGKLFGEVNTKEGLMEGKASYYGEDGKLFAELEYKADEIMKYKFLDKKGKELAKGENKAGKLVYKKYTMDGYISSEGTFEKDKEEGVWKYYSSTGQLTSVVNFKNGLLEGKATYYFPNGTSKQKEYTNKEGNTDGYYKEYYLNGVLRAEGWYKDDMMHGEWKYYYPNGKLDEVKYFTNNVLGGNAEYFYPNGKKRFLNMYDETNTFSRYVEFDTLGNEYQRIDLKYGNGPFKSTYLNGKPAHYGTFKFESYDGPETVFSTDGKKLIEIQNKYGKEHGPKTNYWPNGNVRTADTLEFNELHSIHKEYFEDGKLDRQYRNIHGSTEGDYIAYHPNGSVRLKGTYDEDERHGYFYFYGQDGMLRFRLNYYYGRIMSYSYEDNAGNFVPEIMLVKGTGTIKALYKNGQTSAEIGVEAGMYQGSFKLFYSTGAIEKDEKYLYGDLMGTSKNYLANGKLLSETNYVLDELDGVCTYYTESGVIKSQDLYKLGFKNGPCKIYDAKGNVKQTIFYYYGVPLN